MTQLERLYRLRDYLEQTLFETNLAHTARASVAGQYSDTLDKIAALEAAQAPKEATPLGDIAARRAARAATGTAGASRRRSR